GVGASLSFNQIDGSTRAAVTDSDLELDGALLVSADNDNALRAIAVSAGVGKQTGIAFTIGINIITNDVTAEILGTTLTKAESVTVFAQDDSNIQSIAGALGVGLQSTGFGGALAWNSVFSTVTARIEDSSLTSISGAVSVTAESTETDPLLDGKILTAA